MNEEVNLLVSILLVIFSTSDSQSSGCFVFAFGVNRWMSENKLRLQKKMPEHALWEQFTAIDCIDLNKDLVMPKDGLGTGLADL